MPAKISLDYYAWLTKQIKPRGTRKYSGLYEILHNKEFVWTVPGDQHRVRDSLDLRVEFLNYRTDISRKDVARFNDDMINAATMLELVISLSRRTAFTCGGEPEDWAFKLLENVGLHKISDPVTAQKIHKAEEMLETLIWRTYGRDGTGGFFPLKWSTEDQTKVELWYQMNAYAIELSKS